MGWGILAQVCSRQFKECRRRLQPLLLQMHESAGQLDESLVKRTVCPVLLWQPYLFENIVGFIKELPVETIKEAQVMSIEMAPPECFDQAGNSGALAAHPRSLRD